MPTVQLDENGNRVIIRHTGPPGPAGAGVPAGGFAGDVLTKVSEDDNDTAWADLSSLTGFVEGPASSDNDNLVIFDGTDGLKLKDSNLRLSDVATLSYVQTRTPQIFTTALYDKLSGLSTAVYFRGVFASKAGLVAGVTDPKAGDYAITTDTAEDVYFYDASAADWRSISEFGSVYSGEEIAAVLFNGDITWSQSDCNIFTNEYKALVDQHQVALASLVAGSGSNFSAIATFSADRTVATGDHTLVMLPAAGQTLNVYLPSVGDSLGRVIVVVHGGNVAGGVSVSPQSGQTIKGSAVAPETLAQWDAATFQSTGTDWVITAKSYVPPV